MTKVLVTMKVEGYEQVWFDLDLTGWEDKPFRKALKLIAEAADHVASVSGPLHRATTREVLLRKAVKR